MKVTYKGELMHAGVLDADGQHEYLFEDGQEYDLPEAHVKDLAGKGLSLESVKAESKKEEKKEEKSEK